MKNPFDVARRYETSRTINAAKESLAVRRAVVRNLKLRSAARKVFSALDKAGWGPSLTISESGYGVYCYPRVESFALNEELLRVLEKISEVTGDANWKSTDYPGADIREYVVKADFGGASLRVEINASLKSGSEKCRKVVKAVRNVEVTDYEFVCA
ncbi:MAG: hypothetical protein IT349_19400 [Candidatus Eisenbacteria bacterium]|nr:hypothetical protein [Candidatus Eisenbacteria bacterium]